MTLGLRSRKFHNKSPPIFYNLPNINSLKNNIKKWETYFISNFILIICKKHAK